MAIIFNAFATRPFQKIGEDFNRKRAYAEERLVKAVDRYIVAKNFRDKENAREWMRIWRLFLVKRPSDGLLNEAC